MLIKKNRKTGFPMTSWVVLSCLTLSATLLLHPIASATTYYVDAQNGSDSADGTSASPWKTLQHLFTDQMVESRNWESLPYSDSSTLTTRNKGALIKAGDVITLRSGNYGQLSIIGYYNSSPITITAEEGQTPVFRNVLIRSSQNWILDGIQVDSSAYDTADFSNMISLESHSWTGPISQVNVRNCHLQSIADSSSWSKDDWNNLSKNGLRVDGDSMTIAYNTLLNVNFGISVSATNSLIDHNIVKNFAGDGLRGLGDYTTFQYNTIKNCYDVNDNHDDGFQSWSVGTDGNVGTGVVTGIVLRGNTIINFEDENQPFRGPLQGIGCFDGMFDGWLVEGNRITVDHWHAISFYGGTNMVIRKNIITDNDSTNSTGPPWILLRAHKDGTPAADSEISCNVAPTLRIPDDASIISKYNVISSTGGPMDRHCRSALTGPLLIPIVVHPAKDDEQ